jgi:hypothetical protein
VKFSSGNSLPYIPRARQIQSEYMARTNEYSTGGRGEYFKQTLIIIFILQVEFMSYLP